MIQKTVVLERRVCHTRLRQAFLSGCFEVHDGPVISPVIHWQEKRKGGEEATESGGRALGGDGEQK